MIIPSVDIQNGLAVQLVGGEDLAVDAGDPRPIAQRFARVGEVAVIDLDAAMGVGSNARLIREIVRTVPCRVGGGIRDAQTAIDWLDAGARKVILGTAAREEVLRELPRDRVIAALDARHGEVVIEGWRTGTGASVHDRVRALREHVGGFLVTFVENEGRMGGLDERRVSELVELAGDARVTVAGGVATPEDVALADRAGADAQVGMALYTGAFDLAQGFASPLTSDRPDGLWPTVVCDERGVALGLVYSNLESLRASIDEGAGVYWSRSRRGLWRKGERSGHTQRLLRVEADCDRDALRFVVRQSGAGFCHTGTRTCFGEDAGLGRLDRTIAQRTAAPTEGSYTARLLADPALLRSKLHEEVDELLDARTERDAAWEAADVIYFALVAARAGTGGAGGSSGVQGAGLGAIEAELDRRAMEVTRRPGDAKQTPTQEGGS